MRYFLALPRAYFKNDLYNYASQLEKEKKEERKKEEEAVVVRKEGKRIERERKDGSQSKTRVRQVYNVDDSLTIEIDKNSKSNVKVQPVAGEDLEELMKSMKKKSNAAESANQQNKNVFANGYKPRCSLVVKQEPKVEKTEKEEKNQRKQQYMSLKKIEDNLKQAVKDEAEAGDDKSNAPKKQEFAEPEKTKKIKKQANYQRLDLKRQYKDRFLGGLHNNLRKFTRNGRLRPKYRAQSELTMEDGQLYNSYISSLSRALVTTLNIHDDSSEDCSSSESDEQNQWIAPDVVDKEHLTTCLQHYFGFQQFREGQYETIDNILHGRSTLFISETASGKSLTYILSSMLQGGLSIVISPLVSLMLDQLAHLPKNLPAACISSLINRQNKEKIINMVKQGKINLLFLTPECLQTDFIYNLQDFPQVNFTCIDEAHSLSELSHNFRTSFLALGDIVLNMIKYKNNKPTILGLTATANPETVRSIQEKLQIQEVVRSSNCMNKNLFVTISREKGVLKYESLIRYLNDKLIEECQGILVYTRTRKIMGDVFNYITNSVSSPAAIYHSALTNKEKTETLKKFREGSIKIVVATVALGMGLDFSNLECVIHLNMPKSIENYVQEIGRAGRRQRRAYCHLFLDENDYITERNYILADEIEPSLLSLIYDQLKEHSTIRSYNKKKQQRNSKLEEEQIIKRASIIMAQCQREEQIIYEEEEEQFDSAESVPPEAILKKVNTRFYAMRVEKLKEKTQLREEAILTLLLKIESLLKEDQQVRLKVLPVANEMLKIGFFKSNEEQIKQREPFFKNLIYGCKRAKGTIYINLIDKCNELEMRPIQLLTKLFRISHHYTVKVEQENPIFVWQFQGRKSEEDGGIQYELSQLVQKGFQKLFSSENINRVVNEMNEVQRVSLIKLNVLYSLCFLYSRNHILNILSTGRLLNRNQPIPADAIPKEFDNYFKENLQGFYDRLTNNGSEIYIPTTMVDKKDLADIYGSVELFFRHEMANQGQLLTDAERRTAREKLIRIYSDGKVLTKILMGVNCGQVSWKIYGERSYWMMFKLKNYSELLETVKAMIYEYKEKYLSEQKEKTDPQPQPDQSQQIYQDEQSNQPDAQQ